MQIEKNKLISLNEGDLTPDGDLYIPEGVIEVKTNALCESNRIKRIFFPKSLKIINDKAFCGLPALEYIFFGNNVKQISKNSFYNTKNIIGIRVPRNWSGSFITFFFHAYDSLRKILREKENGETAEYNVIKYQETLFIEKARKTIGQTQIITLQNVLFKSDDLAGKTFYLLKSKNQEVFGYDISNLFYQMKSKLMKIYFNNIIREYFQKKPHLKSALIKHILESSFEATIDEKNYIYVQDKLKFIQKENTLPLVIKKIASFLRKYPKSRTVEELQKLPFHELEKVLFSPPQKSNKKLNKKVKRHPLDKDDLYKLTNDGYKTIGSFPYSWLKNIPKQDIKNISEMLHRYFLDSTRKLYTPSRQFIFDETVIVKETQNLAYAISSLIKQNITIEYLDSGFFSKAYLIKLNDHEKYVWKTYHSDLYNHDLANWNHDIEIQNSFLLSGKKYFGKTHFRKISTATLSSQRGERYLIYPFINAEPRICSENPYDYFKGVILYDLNMENNCHGNTITDMGAIKIIPENFKKPKYVSKITNTILYRPWDDLYLVLNAYTTKQITYAIKFINKNISEGIKNYKTIKAKVEFLSNKLLSRGAR